MLTVFRHTLRRSRGQILGWGIGLFLLGLLMMSMYDSFAGQQEEFAALLELYPPELMAFFGDLESMFASPEGWLSTEYLMLMPLILGIFGVLVGSGMLVSDEENGTLDLILAHPVSRTSLFMGRLFAFVVSTVSILAIAWLGLIVPMSWSSGDIALDRLVLPFVSLLAVLLVFSTLPLLLSMLLPSRRMAATTGGLVLVASFFITGLANINEDLERIAKLSPLNYYQTREAFDGLNGEWLAGLLAAALIFAALAWWLFQRRDIRVGGEGGWRLPWRKA